MALPRIAPYGSWKSPITSDLIVSETIGLGAISLDEADVYWLEVRFKEGGRYVLVRCTPDGTATDLTPPPLNVRTRVHEYGGAVYKVHHGIIFFSNFDDQRIYRQNPGSVPTTITPAQEYRYADYCFDQHRNRAYIADKSDITEELTRAKSHLKQFDQWLDTPQAVGRKLDFLLQEINREVNTIGSKASAAQISLQVVQIKNELEKIREQVQNIL